MPGFSSVISNNVLANHIITLAGKQVQGIGVFDDIDARNNLSGGDGNSSSRVNGFLALVKDADGSGTTKAYIFIGGDSGDPDQGDYVGNSDWTNASNWKEISTFTELSQDTTPQLGGDLDVNGNKITSTSNGNIELDPNGTGNVVLGNFTFDASQSVGAGQDNYVLTYDEGTGLISLEAGGGGGDTDITVVENQSTVTIQSSTGSNDDIQAATTSNAGVMSATDKTRLDAIEDSADVTDSDNVAAAGAVMESDLATNGQLVIGGSSGAAIATLSQGSNVTITNGDGTISIASSHPNISAASSSNNSGRTYIQDITLDGDGHVTGLATAEETVENVDTTYSPGDGLDLNGTTFSTDLKANSGLVIDSGEVSIDVNDVTAAVAEGADTVPDLIREGITGGIEMIGHINSSQGTVKFTFDQFIEAIVSGMINSEVTSGFGSVDTYTGAGSSTPYDLDGNGFIGVSDLLLFLSNFDTAASTTIPRTVLFEYKDDVDDANTNGSLGTVSGSTGTISKVNQVIGVITDTDHFEVNTVGTGEKSVDVTIDNTNGSTTEDMVVFKDQTGGATGDVLISAIGAQSTNGSIKASLGGWTFINTGVGSFSFYLSMKVGRKVGSTYTFSSPVQITQILGTSDFFGIDVALDLSETVVEMNELVLPTVSADDGTVDVKKVFDAGTPSNVDFIAPNTTEVAIQLMYTMIGSGQGQIQQTGRGDVTYTCSVF